jgi:hypothetical protein
MSKYFKFTGDEPRVYPQQALEVDPGQIVYFPEGAPPEEARWVVSSERAAKEQAKKADEPVVEVADQTPDDPEVPPTVVHPDDAPAA